MSLMISRSVAVLLLTVFGGFGTEPFITSAHAGDAQPATSNQSQADQLQAPQTAPSNQTPAPPAAMSETQAGLESSLSRVLAKLGKLCTDPQFVKEFLKGCRGGLELTNPITVLVADAIISRIEERLSAGPAPDSGQPGGQQSANQSTNNPAGPMGGGGAATPKIATTTSPRQPATVDKPPGRLVRIDSTGAGGLVRIDSTGAGPLVRIDSTKVVPSGTVDKPTVQIGSTGAPAPPTVVKPAEIKVVPSGTVDKPSSGNANAREALGVPSGAATEDRGATDKTGSNKTPTSPTEIKPAKSKVTVKEAPPKNEAVRQIESGGSKNATIRRSENNGVTRSTSFNTIQPHPIIVQRPLTVQRSAPVSVPLVRRERK